MPRQPKCPISGCIFLVPDDGLVCHPHALQIWERVQTAHLESAGSAITTESADDRASREGAERRRRTEVSLSPGWIYFLELDDKIKVGWTSNLENRLKSYPPHARMVVEYPATRADERDLHRTLRTELVAGREWYGRTPLVLRCMRDAQLAEDRRRSEEYAAEVASRPPNPPPAPIRRSNPRPLRGQALDRPSLLARSSSRHPVE
jgi:hypothetical protein